MIACSSYNPPTTNSGEKYDSKTLPEFTLKVSAPLTVQITNQNMNEQFFYSWGDGTSESGICPTHRYKEKGVYKIVAKFNSREFSKIVTIEEPTQCYITGIRYDKIGKENKYYYVKIIDDDFFTTTWLSTSYVLLSSAIIPYDYTLKTPKYMNGLSEDDYYYIQCFWNDKGSGDGTQILKQKILTSEIMKYPNSITKTSDNKDTEITVFFGWK